MNLPVGFKLGPLALALALALELALAMAVAVQAQNAAPQTPITNVIVLFQ